MNVDVELEQWREQWQAGAAIPLDLRAKVERQSRWMRIGLAADLLVTLVIGGSTLAWAVRSPQPDILLLAAATWVFLAAAWAFTLSVHRDNWRPAAEDTTTFLELSVRRCRGRLAAVWFGAGLYICEIAFCLGWLTYREPGHHLNLLSNKLIWLVTVAFFVALFWYRRRKLRELENLEQMRVGLAGTLR